VDLETQLKAAIARAYDSAGVYLHEKHLASLASVYAAWAEGVDETVVDRIERAPGAALRGSVA
jgi:hypothetical protein